MNAVPSELQRAIKACGQNELVRVELVVIGQIVEKYDSQGGNTPECI